MYSPVTFQLSSQSTIQYNPPVKLDFPTFSNTQEDDPVVFIERCEEYFDVRPLSHGEILASLSAVLKDTAKDWWMAERRNVHNWRQFKGSFLHSFLSEDYEDVAAGKLVERKQGAKESIRYFVFHYRAFCLRWRKEMSEKEVVQAILRNCNPRLASLLRGAIKDVGELVRIGTQIERDFDESKRYWSQANVEEQRKKAPIVQEPQRKPPCASNRVVQSFHSSEQHDYKNNLRIKRCLRLGKACVCVVILSKMADHVTRGRRMVNCYFCFLCAKKRYSRSVAKLKLSH